MMAMFDSVENDFVSETHKAQAMRRLAQRIKEGEEPAAILKTNDTYYCDKVVKGLVPLSYRMYSRIMRTAEEDGVDEE